MLVLGTETSCDETGVAIYDTRHGLLSHALYSQTEMHGEYGGVVPELASRDHIRRVLPLIRQTLAAARRVVAGARPRVLICFGRAEDFRRLTAAAPGTIHDDLITQAGGMNVLTSGTVAYPTLSAEGAMRLNPDVIIEFSSGGTDAAALRGQWSRLDSVRAVMNGRVYVFIGDFLSVPGPRFARFADTVARAIRGER